MDRKSSVVGHLCRGWKPHKNKKLHCDCIMDGAGYCHLQFVRPSNWTCIDGRDLSSKKKKCLKAASINLCYPTTIFFLLQLYDTVKRKKGFGWALTPQDKIKSIIDYTIYISYREYYRAIIRNCAPNINTTAGQKALWVSRKRREMMDRCVLEKGIEREPWMLFILFLYIQRNSPTTTWKKDILC